MNPHDLIANLSLQPHPEGGWYRQTYRSAQQVDTPRGPRAASTAIYFLLQEGQFSALHRIASDEVWHFYLGSPLKIEAITPEGALHSFILGPNLATGQVLQAWVPAGHWFGASLPEAGWALVGCTVAPGFDFTDFEMKPPARPTSNIPAMRRRSTKTNAALKTRDPCNDKEKGLELQPPPPRSAYPSFA